jgi:uncharacterized protein (TIGR02646 family)
MRRLPSRPELPENTQRKLHLETRRIRQAGDPRAEAKARFERARSSGWFEPVVQKLGEWAGPGQRCMWCSGSESAQVEHYRPKSTYPKRALTWKNLLWACGLCNGEKGATFPTQRRELLINPAEEDVWHFFFIDQFGNLTPRWRTDLDDFDPRAVSTRETLRLDRQALQESRQLRRLDLIKQVQDTLARYNSKELDVAELRRRKGEWLRQPFQPDVADYFFNGPGRSEPPFRQFHAIVE